MAGEKYLEFLLSGRSPVFSQEIRKTSFFSSSHQKNRRRRRFKLFIFASMLACNSIERRCWVLPCSDRWFQIVETVFTDKEWYDNFCVSKATFQFIVSEIEAETVRKNTAMHKAVSPSKRTA